MAGDQSQRSAEAAAGKPKAFYLHLALYVVVVGGLIVIDQATCIVELARFFLDFLANESCGKCPPCRIGTRVLLNLLERITNGQGRIEDLEVLKSLGEHVRRTSLCGLGQTAPNAVLSTLRHFRDEYEAHLSQGRCPAAQCRTAS